MASASAELLHPAFVATAAKIASALERRGNVADGDGQVFRASRGAVTLEIRAKESAKDWTIVEARHQGADESNLAAVLDVFCRTIETLPLLEAADHGAIHALARFQECPLIRPVPGILTPRSAGIAFRVAEELIRTILAGHHRKSAAGEPSSTWTPPLSERWRKSVDTERLGALNSVVAKFRAAQSLGDADLWIAEIDRMRRVVVAFGPQVDYRRKPALLLRLEVEMREATGERLEVFMAEASDSNSIRRLRPEEER